jgi:hypothetical protein
MVLVDFKPLLNPQKVPAGYVIKAADGFSWGLPAVSAILAILAGCAALNGADRAAAVLSIAGGVLGALGVLATNYASRIRDHRIEIAKGLAGLSIDMVESVQRTLPLA